MFNMPFHTNIRLLGSLLFMLSILPLFAKKSYCLHTAYFQTLHPQAMLAEHLLSSGEQLMEQEQWRESLYYLLKADKLYRCTNDTPNIIRTKHALYGAYYKLGILDSATLYIDQMLDRSEAVEDFEAEMKAWNCKAILYQTDLELDSAHLALSYAYELATHLHDKKSQASFSSNLGIVFGLQGHFEKAEEYFRKAYELGIASNDTTLMALGANNLTRVFTEAAQYDSATYYSHKAYRYAQAVRAKKPHSYYKAIDFQALLALRKGNLEYAEKKYQELARIYENLQETVFLAEVYARLAEINLARKDPQTAIKYARQNLDLLKDLRADEAREKALLTLMQAYRDIEDFRAAYYFSEQYQQLRDSAYNEKLAQLVSEMNNNFELANTERENARLLIEAHHNEAARRNWTIIALIAGLVIVLAAGTILFFILEVEHKKKLTRKLEAEVQERTAALWESNKKLKSYVDELQTFSYISSHDLKEPLRNISGFVRLLEKRIGHELDVQSLEFMGYIKRNAAQMHEMLEDIQTYSTIDHGNSSTESVSLSKIMTNVTDSLESLLDEKNAVVTFQNLPNITANESQLFMILKNLVENGVKYNNSQPPLIQVSYHREANAHLIQVKDNGIGIANEYHEQIFQLFKRLHNRSEFSGTGMGLSISRKMAQRHGGQLSLHKSAPEETIFELRLPLLNEPALTASAAG